MGSTADDAPITLKDAVDYFNGALTIASLRAEARRGNLNVYRVGRRDFTTIADLKNMMQQCRVVQPVRATNAKNNLSETERHSVARAAALEAVEALKRKKAP